MINKNWSYRIVSILCIAFFCTQLSGQINLKVGYATGYSSLDAMEKVVDAYNQQFAGATVPLEQVHFHHGLEIGARYKFGRFAFDFGLMTMSGNAKAEGLPENAGLVEQELQSTHTHYYLGVENYLGWFGYGGSVGYGRLKYKIDFANVSKKQEVFSQRELSSKFYLLFEFPGNNVAFQLRPYVIYPISTYNLKELETNIVPDSAIPSSELDQDIFVYGISLLFMNGPQ